MSPFWGGLVLLWRLRRATTIETGLFEIQADYLSGFRRGRQVNPASREVVCALFGRADPVSCDPTSHDMTNGTETVEPGVDPTADRARCFLRLANLPSYPLDQLSRYEAILWRQAGQILFALDALYNVPTAGSPELPLWCFFCGSTALQPIPSRCVIISAPKSVCKKCCAVPRHSGSRRGPNSSWRRLIKSPGPGIGVT